jgi:nitrate reductase gamma subunit
MLIHRRLADPRIRANTRPWDIAILAVLWIQLALGLWTISFSAQHIEGGTFLQLVQYVQGIVVFRAGNADLLLGVPWVYKAHIALGLTIFLLFPFTRLAHIWSGFATIAYLFRPPQLVRTRGTNPRGSFGGPPGHA